MARRSKVDVRWLTPGEAVPPGVPQRHASGHGYVQLKWKVGTNQYVTTYEHRVFGGRVSTAEHVHHINGNKADNCPENLEPIAAREHYRRHRDPMATVFQAEYESGATLTAISKKYGRNSGTIHRMLALRGAAPRGKAAFTGENQWAAVLTEASVVEIRRRRAAGETLAALAREFGVALSTIWMVASRTNWAHVPGPAERAK